MGEAEKEIFTPEVIELILRIIKRGKTVEIKKENNKLVIVEIDRRVKRKTFITG